MPSGVTVFRCGWGQVQRSAGDPGIQRPDTGAYFFAEQDLAHAGESIGIPEQPVEHRGVEQQWAAAQYVMHEQRSHGLDGGQALNRFLEMKLELPLGPGGNQRQVVELGLVCGQLHLVAT